MIAGIGIDSIEIARVAEKCDNRDSRFKDKMFTELERRRSSRNQYQPYQHLAACFAAREAFYKATQIWYRRQEVSVTQEPSGKPCFVLSERVKKELGGRRVELSLTHDDTYATAMVVCEDTLGRDALGEERLG
ncbi:holo-ACP synthase [bacterium]|nr:holo-ACP synthase [bacterium]